VSMSNIINYLKCEHCGKEFKDIYISFGHNEYCFDYIWKCGHCEKKNVYKVKSYGGHCLVECTCEERKKEQEERFRTLRYKIGDTIRVKSILNLNDVYPYGIYFSKEQLRMVGKVAKVEKITDFGGYGLHFLDDEYDGVLSWDDFMLEDFPETE
jgi:hypothetical protein